MKSDGLGADRHSRKPRSVRRFARFCNINNIGVPCFTRFLLIMMVSVSMFLCILLAKTVVFLKGWLANTAWRSVCRGSGAQEPDSTQFLMAGAATGAARSEPELQTTVSSRPVRVFVAFTNAEGRAPKSQTALGF